MTLVLHNQSELDAATRACYFDAMETLTQANVPFLIGGAYALARFTGVVRHTKDFDVFIRPADLERALAAFANRGQPGEMTFPHWLAKVYFGENFIDLIFSSGNGLVDVDDEWFEHAIEETVLGRSVLLCPPEEMIWSKAFIMERERYDGADVNHMLRACAANLDWPRLVRRFGKHWRLLLSHLVLFSFVYPSERRQIPPEVLELLMDRLRQEQAAPAPAEKVCLGTVLSREQYLVDIQQWGYKDARLPPQGKMSVEAIAHWTAAIGNDHPAQPGEQGRLG